MAFTQNDIDRLKAAIASGAHRVRFEDGRETEYRSVSSLKEALRMAEAEVASNSGQTYNRKHTIAGF